MRSRRYHKLLESFYNTVFRDTINAICVFRTNKSAIYSLDHIFHLYHISSFIQQISTGPSENRILGALHRPSDFYKRTSLYFFFTKIILYKNISA